jgi:hypothetical protein
MPSASLDKLLARLEEARRRFGPENDAPAERLLDTLARRSFPDADSLIRFHEILLFLRAYPRGEGILRRAEDLLSTFSRRVERLRRSRVDMIAFDYMEYSGIAGTELKGTYGYAIARWLEARYPASVSIDWEGYERGERLGHTLPRFLPLLYEDSLVEANVPYTEWLRAAAGRGDGDLRWLLGRFDRLPVSEREKAELYDSLELKIRWKLNDSRAARTHLRLPARKVFYHEGPLIKRSEVSLERELASPPALKRLPRPRGQKMIDMLREATVSRYRELYGITHGDPESVVRASVGRGVEILLWGLPRDRRLPLRAYHSGFTLKNGVPVDYIEGISLFDRMELGFNLFYTFRDGESAWIYAQVLRVLRRVTGAGCFSVDPYQLGFNNDEAIESGAFWFYRKLGFRPTRPELASITEREERKMGRRPGYKSPAEILRRLSRGNMVYEIPGSSRGYWDRFHIRNLGLAAQSRMAARFDGDSEKFARASMEKVGKALGIGPASWREPAYQAFSNLALVLALIPDLSRWTEAEKRGVSRIIRAKMSADESKYLLLLQRHSRLRDAIRALGS